MYLYIENNYRQPHKWIGRSSFKSCIYVCMYVCFRWCDGVMVFFFSYDMYSLVTKEAVCIVLV